MSQNSTLFRPGLLLAPLLALSACASVPGPDAPPLDVRGAEVSSRTMDNGDTVQEYRIGGQLRMVKVTPPRGPSYYLYDRDGDGHFDNDRNAVSPVYWKIYSW